MVPKHLEEWISGSLEPEKGADLFLVDTNRLEFVGAVHDPKNFLARTGVTGLYG